MFDSIQVILSGIIRGMGKIKIAAYATLIAYYPIM